MLIGKKYKIESDSLNITVFEGRLTKKDKREYWKAIGYFSSLAGALKFLVDLGVKETGLKDLKTISAKQEELYALIGSLRIERDAL